ncbi:MAG TPA: hypothetical protein VHM19_03910, partial [Polyangiales bacterium]|nr:hypothetical protein [Polyangiales bacterium]
QLAVTCDWLDHRLSLVDLAKLKKGKARKDGLLGEVDLSAYPAGPLDMTVVPGTHIALVTLSAGFFSLSSFAGVIVDAKSIPTDPGKVIFVDLDKRKVVGELVTGKHPVSIAVTPDGKRAFVTHFGTPQVAVIDVDKMSLVKSVNVGIYSEGIALDETGEVGIFSYSAAGNVRTFAASDLEGTLSPEIELPGDSAGVAFFPGTKIAYVVESPMPLTSAKGGHTVIDASDPQHPKTLESVRLDTAPNAYPIVADPERKSVLVPGTAGNKITIDEITVDDQGKIKVVQSIEAGSTTHLLGAYGMALGADGRVWLAAPDVRGLIAVDLDAKSSYPVAWGSPDASPTCIALLP